MKHIPIPTSRRSSGYSRRGFLALVAGAGVAALAPGQGFGAQGAAVGSRPIPATGERLPLVGLGSWITFNVGDDKALRDGCTQVMGAFFAAGGRLIDSSPMYGSSQEVIGAGLHELGMPRALFAADKVWVGSRARGVAQIEQSRRNWQVPRFDLLQVHNLLDWEAHLPTLFAMKAEGRLRYVGITTSHGRRHDELEAIMRKQPLDFVQVTYNAVDRDVENRILPLARDRGMAVIVNRPFQGGELIQRLQAIPLPAWAEAAGASSWAQFLLRFIISHPAVTCAIPATTRVEHVRENLAAAASPLPDEGLRRRMAAHVEAL